MATIPAHSRPLVSYDRSSRRFVPVSSASPGSSPAGHPQTVAPHGNAESHSPEGLARKYAEYEQHLIAALHSYSIKLDTEHSRISAELNAIRVETAKESQLSHALNLLKKMKDTEVQVISSYYGTVQARMPSMRQNADLHTDIRAAGGHNFPEEATHKFNELKPYVERAIGHAKTVDTVLMKLIRDVETEVQTEQGVLQSVAAMEQRVKEESEQIRRANAILTSAPAAINSLSKEKLEEVRHDIEKLFGLFTSFEKEKQTLKQHQDRQRQVVAQLRIDMTNLITQLQANKTKEVELKAKIQAFDLLIRKG